MDDVGAGAGELALPDGGGAQGEFNFAVGAGVDVTRELAVVGAELYGGGIEAGFAPGGFAGAQ